MEDQVTQEIQQEEQSQVDIITELKANTVPKEQYSRLEDEYNRALKALINNETWEVEAPDTPSREELTNALFTEEVQRLGACEYWDKTLKLRDLVMQAGEQDPFVPFGSQTGPTDEDFATAEKVAKVVKECLDLADGQDNIFCSQLMSRTMDVQPLSTRRRSR